MRASETAKLAGFSIAFHDARMISRDEMFEGLLSACPSFLPTWREFCEEWEDDEDELPLYLALCDLAHHLIGMLERREYTELQAVFDVVEQWHMKGDDYVKEAATIGLLEDLSNIGLHKTTSRDDIVRFLGPESKYWWAKVIALWEQGQPIVDDR